MVLQDLKTDDLTRKSLKEFNNLLENLRQFIFRKKKNFFALVALRNFFIIVKWRKFFHVIFQGVAADFSELFFGMLQYARSPTPVDVSKTLHTKRKRTDILLAFWHTCSDCRKVSGKKNVFSKTWAPCVQAKKTFRHSPTTRNWLNFADKPKMKLFSTRWESAMRSALAD